MYLGKYTYKNSEKEAINMGGGSCIKGFEVRKGRGGNDIIIIKK